MVWFKGLESSVRHVSQFQACCLQCTDAALHAVQGASKTAGQAIQARAAAAALQEAQKRLGSCQEASGGCWVASVKPGQPTAHIADVPHTVRRQIVAGRRVLQAMERLKVCRLR